MGVNIRISVAARPRRGHTVYTLCHCLDFASRISLLFTISMLFRGRSADATPNPISPPLASGSVSGRRPLNLVTNRQPFRASTAQNTETESFVSSPREILPTSPRPASFPPSPPGSSGHRRQLPRHDTQETLWSPTFEERASPEPPSFKPMPTPPVLETPELLVSPTRSPQPAPGGGVGEYASTPKPATHLDSSPPSYETAGTSEGMHAGFWPTYNKVSQAFDQKRLNKWNGDLDILLIFVSLMVKGYH